MRPRALDTRTQRLLSPLASAGRRVVSFGDLAALCVEQTAQLVYELELAGWRATRAPGGVREIEWPSEQRRSRPGIARGHRPQAPGSAPRSVR